MEKQEYKKPVMEVLEIDSMEVVATSQSLNVSDDYATETARSKKNFWKDID